MNGIFETQQEVEMEWRDGRVKFHNLLPLHFQNSLSEAEKDDLWIPTLTFTNTAHQERSRRDNSSLVTVARLGSLERSGLCVEKNIYIYKGEENPLHINRVYSTKWLCSYDMTWYPFDTQVGSVCCSIMLRPLVQVCNLVLAPSGNLDKYVNLSLGNHTYSGDRELTQYFIR